MPGQATNPPQPLVVAALPFRISAPAAASFPFALWNRLTRHIDARERQSLARRLALLAWVVEDDY